MVEQVSGKSKQFVELSLSFVGFKLDSYVVDWKRRKPERKATKGQSTPKIVDAEVEFALLDNAPLIMHGVICGGQTHNRGYANTYSYLCFILHLCTFHQSICRSSTRYGYSYMCNSMASFYMCMYTWVIYIYIERDVCI